MRQNRGSILLFVLILATVFALAVLSLSTRVNMSSHAQNNISTEGRIYQAVSTSYQSKIYDQYFIGNEVTALTSLVRNGGDLIADANDESWFNQSDTRVEIPEFKPNEDISMTSTFLDNNALYPYCWKQIYSDRTNIASYMTDKGMHEEIVSNLSSVVSFSNIHSGGHNVEDAFLASSGIPRFFRTVQLTNYEDLCAEFSAYRNTIALDAMNDYHLTWFGRYISIAARRIFWNDPQATDVDPDNDVSIVKLNINLINHENFNEYYKLLNSRYSISSPGVYDRSSMFRQYLINIKDSVDADSVPSVVDRDGNVVTNDSSLMTSLSAYDNDDAEPLHRGNIVVGRERTVAINEVWPDTPYTAATDDDGEFIELYNWTDETVDIEDFEIRVYDRDSSNHYSLISSFILQSFVIPAGGYLILTDDYNDVNDMTPDSRSLFDSLGIVLAPGTYEEHSFLDIPNARGRIELWDRSGSLIDAFDYEDMLWNGVTRSAARFHPLCVNPYNSVDLTSVTEDQYDDLLFPTPGQVNLVHEQRCYPHRTATGTESNSFSIDAGKRVPPLDRAFYNIAELLLIPTEGAQVAIVNSLSVDPNDTRRVVFCPYPMSEPYFLAGGGEQEPVTTGVLDLFYVNIIRDELGNPVGQVNVNTAPKEVLTLMIEQRTSMSGVSDQIELGRPWISMGELAGHVLRWPLDNWKNQVDNTSDITGILNATQVSSYADFADFAAVKSSDVDASVHVLHNTRTQASLEYDFELRMQRNSD